MASLLDDQHIVFFTSESYPSLIIMFCPFNYFIFFQLISITLVSLGLSLSEKLQQLQIYSTNIQKTTDGYLKISLN